MSYTSTLLTPSTNIATLATSTKGIDYRTDFERLLEFHDEIYTARFKYDNQYYKALMESDEVLNEGVFSAISAFISTIINGIRSIFSVIFGGGRSGPDKSNNTFAAKIAEAIDKNKKSIKDYEKRFITKYNENKLTDKKVKIRVYSFGFSTGSLPEISENTVLSQDCLAMVKKANSGIKDLIAYTKANGASSPSAEANETMKNAYQKSIEEYTACKNAISELKPASYEIFKHDEQEVGADTIYQYLSRINLYDNFNAQLGKYSDKTFPDIDTALKELEDVKAVLDNQEKNSTNDNDKDRIVILRPVFESYNGILLEYTNKIREYVAHAKNAIKNQYDDLLKSIKSMLADEIQDNDETAGGDAAVQAQEEAAILDEQFSNSLAATMTDLRWSYMDAYRQGYVNEAVIRTENKDVDKKLIELNEAIGMKVKSAFNSAVAKIRELFAKFMEKLRRNVTSTKNYLDKYKKYILSTTINTDYNTKNIIEGMHRVMNYVIPAFDFKSISDNGGLDNPKNFFDLHLMKTVNKNGRQPNVNIDTNTDQTLSQIGEWFKQYFGCSGETITILATDFQKYIKDIYDFMYDISKIEKSINDSIKNIEGLRERALRQAGVPIENQTQAPNESTIYLGHTPVLLEMEKVNNPQQTTNTQQGTSNNYTGATASQITNVASTTNKDANGQEQYGVDQTTKEDVDAKCNVYIQTVTKVLQAKLTAVEFLRNEFMVLFKDIVDRNIEGTANPSGINPTNTSNMPRKQQ